MKKLFTSAALALFAAFGLSATEYSMMPASATISAQGNGYALIFNWDPSESVEVVPNVENNYAVINSTVLKDAAGNQLDCKYEPASDAEDWMNPSLYGYGLIPQGWTFEDDTEYTLVVPQGAFGSSEWESSGYVKGIANPVFTVVFTTGDVKSITEGATTPDDPTGVSYIEPLKTYVQELSGIYSVVFKMFEADEDEAYILDDNYESFNKATLTTADGTLLDCKYETGFNNDSFFDYSTIGYAFAPQGWTFEEGTQYILNVPAAVFGDEAWKVSNGEKGVCNQGMKVTFTTTEIVSVEYVTPGETPVVPGEVTYDFTSWSGSIYAGNLMNPSQTEGYTLLLDWPAAAYDGGVLTPVVYDTYGESALGVIVTGGMVDAREPKAYGWYITGIGENITYKLEVRQGTVGNELWKENNGVVGQANPPLTVTFTTDGITDVAVGEILPPASPTFNIVEAPKTTLANFNMADCVELTLVFDDVVYMLGDSSEAPLQYGWTLKDENGDDVDCSIIGVFYPSGHNWQWVSTYVTGLDFRKEGKYTLTVPANYFGNRVWARHEGMFGEYNEEITVEIDPFSLYTSNLKMDFTPTATKFEMKDVGFDVYDPATGKVVDTEYVYGLLATLTYDEKPWDTPALSMDELKELGFGLHNLTNDEMIDCKVQFVATDNNDLQILFSDLNVDLYEGQYYLMLPMNMVGNQDWWMSWASSGRCNPTDYITVTLPLQIDYTFEPLIRVRHVEDYVHDLGEGETEEIPSAYEVIFKFPANCWWYGAVEHSIFTDLGATFTCGSESYIPTYTAFGPADDYTLFYFYFWGFPENGEVYTFTVPAGLFGDAAWMYDEKGATANPELVIPIETVSGVEAVTVDALNGVEAVYNLNGVKVDADNLTPGVYVRIANGKATKVLVK